MKPELEEIIQHHGVKGMKWGQHLKSTVQTHVGSMKREHSWAKQLKNAGTMSTKDLQRVASRAQLENDLKRLSKKSNVGSEKDKQDYLKRAGMSDQELFRKVQRLRVKENLNRNANDATKTQREMAKKIVQIAAPLALQYALTKSLSKKDVFNTFMNPGGAKAKVMKAIMDAATKSKVKHGEDIGDTLMHSLELGVEDETLIEELMEDFSDDEIAEMVAHNIGDEDTLQHHGVKGMHWGVHRDKIKAAIKNHITKVRQKQNKRTLAYHEKHKDNKTYKKLYARNSKKYKTHLAAAQHSQRQHMEIKRARVRVGVQAAVLAAPALATGAGVVGRAAHKVATNPDNIRKAKNVVQAMKRSPVRYVDGKQMKNVVKTVYNHGL